MNIVVSGYYGFGNAGDELILESIVGAVRKCRPDAEINVLSCDPEMTGSRYRVKAIDRWNWIAIARAVRRSDMVLSGGGGLFQDNTGSLSLYYYLAIIALSWVLRKKIIVYGVGVNELRRCNARLTAWVLNRAFRITVREEDSARLLLRWGCSPDKVIVSADPVLLLEPAARSCDPSHPQVAFIVRPPANGQWPVAAFARLADAVARQLNARIVFIPFHVREDVPFTRAVRDAMSMPAEIASWETGTDLFRTVSRSDFIISGRLHGVILAALNGVPFVGISEDPKIERFLKELGLHRIPDAGNIEMATLLPLVLETWSCREEFCRDITSHLLPMRARVRRVSDLLFGCVCSGDGRPNKIE